MARQLERKDAVGGREVRSFALSIKAAEDGTVEGYGSVFGVRDSYDDVIAKGAFSGSIAEHKAAGTMPAMLWQHDAEKPIGVWTEMSEDANGLRVKGRLALDTTLGKEAHALLKMGALNGLSIGFMSKQWAYDRETEVRTLTEIDLWEVSLVTFPANEKARVTNVKAVSEDSVARAIKHLTAAIKLHEAHMDGSEPTSEESQMRMMKMMKDALSALQKAKGADDDDMEDMEDMGKSMSTPKNAERILRDAGFSRSDATAFVSRVMRMGEVRSDSANSTAVAMKAADRLLRSLTS
ncbi:HK97 family phage prohead protease [uncultured Aquabacterium sp.]|uniref:HK97 family phage prohead protease n=1 Tax=uncultured Aquabacterium sp. TaxID=158753 RepID=UPI0025CDF92F|nr:HK97 family phage prohead protease [uncultured Aquabacterium sp.]